MAITCKPANTRRSKHHFGSAIREANASPNGEDHLYVFYNRASGDYVLLSYNMIEQHVETPILCNGFSIFEEGKLIYFKSDDAAQKHHAMQVWQTP